MEMIVSIVLIVISAVLIVGITRVVPQNAPR
jgi:hypothetical protein